MSGGQTIKKLNKISLLIMAVLIVWQVVQLPLVGASISQCIGSVAPRQVAAGSNTQLTFQYANIDANNTIKWISIEMPSGYFTGISNVNAPGWSVAVNQDGVKLTGGSLGPGDQQIFTLNAQAFGGQSPPATWYSRVSDNPSGSGNILCDGDLDVEVTAGAPPQISNISPSNLTAHSITLAWNTDKPATTHINYGQTNGYGSEMENNSLTTSHSLTLTNLKADKAYHYQLVSDDGFGSATSTDDSTFLTPIEGTTGSGSSSSSGGGASGVITTNSKQTIPIKAVATEHEPPTVNIATNFAKPFKKAPLISGTAADNEATARVEYSLDNGKNWLPTDVATGLGGKQVDWSFTPDDLEDGNYQLVMRVIDTSGNRVVSPTQNLVIDRLPPQVGGVVNTVGPQIISPISTGVLYSMAGVDQKITLSSIGGATSVKITAEQPNGEKGGAFYLTRSADTGLWTGVVSFKEPGAYNLIAESIDGAGNQTKRVLETIYALAPTSITDQKTNKEIAGVRATIYYLEPESNSWVIWDSEAYGQANPQVSKKDGHVNWLLPAGKYYLRVQAAHYKTYESRIFKLTQPTPIITPVKMEKSPRIGIGRFGFDLPSWKVTKADITPRISTKTKSGLSALAGQPAPAFKLQTINGQTVSNLTYSGKPTVLSFVSTWSPAAKDQYGALAATQSNPDINVVAVDIQESDAKVGVYVKIGGYNLQPIVDPDGTTVSAYQVQNLPTHYFLDRHGTIKKVMTGVLSKQQLLDNLGGL